MDLKLQLWLIQAAFLVQKSSLPTLVNNSNFSESHPWQSTGVMLMGSKTQLLHVETGLPVLQETADRPVSGSVSVGFLSCDRPREEVDGKSASASGLRNCTHTHTHTPQVFRGQTHAEKTSTLCFGHCYTMECQCCYSCKFM